MRKCKWLALTAAALMLTSCSLLPVEMEQRSVPVIKSYTQPDYTLAYAQWGDVVLTENVSCKYMPVSVEMLAFPIGGEYFGGIYVQKGDMVTAGQLLAELDTQGLDERITRAEADIASQEMDIRHLTERRDLDVQARRALLAADPNASGESADDLLADWNRRIRSAKDSLAVAQERLEELRASLAQRRLYAGIDGAVTYVRTVKEGSQSVEGEAFIRVADASNSVFFGQTAHYDLLPEGTLVTLLVNREEVEASVVSAETLGLADDEPNSKGQKTVYFRLVTPDGTLEAGDRATLTLLLAQSSDTLYIPARALHTVGDRKFVYRKDENGLKIMVDVEIGLVTNTYVEVLSGLEEGDNVIL